MMARWPRPLEVKFWELVKSKNAGECWMFKNCKPEKYQYGFVIHGGKQYLPHRVSWYLHYGEIPEGMFVLHSCDTPGCVNPDHLFLGTQADNVKDMIAKGRQAKSESTKHNGEKNGRSKLTDAERLEIVELRRSGELRKDIAFVYNVTEGQISRICKSFGLEPVYPKKWTSTRRRRAGASNT